MNRGRVSTQVVLGFLVIMLLIVSGCSSKDDAFLVASVPTLTYSISGTVNGAVLDGVAINLTGAATTSVTTDSSGAFTITGLASGEYTVTPVKAGYIFTPSSWAVTVSGANVAVPNFAAGVDPAPTASRYSISGAVTGDVNYQVIITLTNAGFATTRTDTSGNYTLSNLVTGTYTVTPSLAGYTFSPVSATATVSGANVTVPNFTAIADSVSYTQDDLTGIWNINILRKGTSRNEWERVKISVDGTGKADCVYISNSTKVSVDNSRGETTCPVTFDLTLAISPTGVITQTGADAVSNGHMMMTSKKNFIAGTGTSTDSSYQLAIMQKEARVTLSADLNSTNTSFSVNAGANFSSGTVVVQIDDEKISGTYSQTTNKFTNCTRGYDSTTAAAHAQDALVTGLVFYTSADLLSKNFVYHQLQVGKINQWEHAIGQAGANGSITLTSLTSPSGSASDMPKALGVSFVLDTTTGVVTISGTNMASFQGFLSDDKKTIVGTFTDNIADMAAADTGQNDYHLIIFQMTDQTYLAGALPAGVSVAHLLGIGTQIGWSYFTNTVAGGGMTFSDFYTSNTSFTIPATTSGSISASGFVTIAGISSYDGQMSHDGKFIVGTQTLSSGVYSLQVNTK